MTDSRHLPSSFERTLGSWIEGWLELNNQMRCHFATFGESQTLTVNLENLFIALGSSSLVYKRMQLDWASGSQPRLLIGTT